jgi:hypothetical protein
MIALLRFGLLGLLVGITLPAGASETPCASCPGPVVYQQTYVADDSPPSWIFRRSNYTHDPETGARVAQYQRLPAIEPLDDERLVTSRYHRTRSTLRGVGGSVETYYDVQSWGNGRGGIDAEWERFHDAWRESYLQGGFYNQGPGFGGGYPGPYGYGGFGAPGYGFGFPGYGFPAYGHGGYRRGNDKPGHGHDGHGHDDHDDHHGHHGDNGHED